MYRVVWKALLAGAVAIGVSSAASAQSTTGIVQRSGNAFHVPVCPGPTAPGTARCHAHVVTDVQGNPLVRPNAGTGLPSGHGPADLGAPYEGGARRSTA